MGAQFLGFVRVGRMLAQYDSMRGRAQAPSRLRRGISTRESDSLERLDSDGLGRLPNDQSLRPGVPPHASETAEPARDLIELDLSPPRYRGEGLRLLWDFLQKDPADGDWD
jgi:hypothetical protein